MLYGAVMVLQRRRARARNHIPTDPPRTPGLPALLLAEFGDLVIALGRRIRFPRRSDA